MLTIKKTELNTFTGDEKNREETVCRVYRMFDQILKYKSMGHDGGDGPSAIQSQSD